MECVLVLIEGCQMRFDFAARWTAFCLLALCLTSTTWGQEIKGELYPPRDTLAQGKPKTEVSAAIVPTEAVGVITLQVKVDLPEGVNTYSMSPDLPKPTRILFTLPDGWSEVDKEFKSDPAPKKEYDEAFEQEMEKFYDVVIFSRRYRLPAGVNPALVKLPGKINMLICDAGSCMPLTLPFEATFNPKGLKKKAEKVSLLEEIFFSDNPVYLTSEEPERVSNVPLTTGYQITPKRNDKPDHVQLQFELTPADAKAGETVTLAITMTLEDGWKTYGLEKADESQIEQPTVVNVTPSNLKFVDSMVSVPPPEVVETDFGIEIARSNTHKHRVTWQQKFQVVEDAPYGVAGSIRYQICFEDKCLNPVTVKFALGNQQTAAIVEGARPITESFAAVTAAVTADEKELSFKGATVGSDLSMFGAFLGAFIAGLLMNVMPCVLPVLAIKILSLVQQAGEKRSRIIALNFAYTLGVMSVFMVFAVISWGLGHSFSAIFQNETFMIVMACVVFLMGLSLFGVFELPVPGILPSATHHTEGLGGAFNTGIIATVLGTPCIGPFIAPVFTWSLSQPPAVVFSIFGMMGIGMASPFLLTGIFPAMVNWLPRPGDWMVKFKQFTGFVLMGTVIWLLFTIDLLWRGPVLILLLALAMLVWVNENLAQNHDPRWKRWRAHILALVASAPVFLFGLWMLQHVQPDSSKMPWEQFSEAQLTQFRAEGKPMLIDFTADWCVICKLNETFALEHDETVKFVKEHGFIPMMADFSRPEPEILKWLRKFGQESVPLTLIIPPGKDSEIIALRGRYSQAELLEKLKEAVSQQAEVSSQASLSGRSTTL